MRIYPESAQPPLQYITPTPPSTTPSPGQPHQQYHPGAQPSPAAGAPTYTSQGASQQIYCPMNLGPPPPIGIPSYFQGAQPGHHQQPMVLMHQQHPTQ